MTTRIFHNPNCSKCRETLALLNDAHIEVEVVEYLATPPSREELIEILSMLNMQPRELMRSHEDEYIDNQLGDEALSDEALIDAMLRFPRLIERPIVIRNGKAIIGRPPVNVKTIL